MFLFCFFCCFFCLIFLPLQAEWVALNYVPFAERSLEVVVDLYHKTACHKAVINEKVLQNIIKVFNPRWFSGQKLCLKLLMYWHRCEEVYMKGFGNRWVTV